MAKLGQPGQTVPQKQEMRERWMAGESLAAIALALGRPAATCMSSICPSVAVAAHLRFTCGLPAPSRPLHAEQPKGPLVT